MTGSKNSDIRQVKTMSDYLDEIKNASQTSLKKAVGESTWDALDPSIKTGALTSEICLKTLEGLSNADFSASIMPLMKVLENELIRHFYAPYLKFVEEKYSPQEYMSANRLNERDKNPNDLRRKILYYNRYAREYRFCSLRDHDDKIKFTIGNYQFTVGAENYSKQECDPTAVRFYKERVFGPSADESAIIKWVCNLTEALDSLVLLRNDSAHAGIIQSEEDANTAMDTLIKVDQVLLTLVFPKLP